MLKLSSGFRHQQDIQLQTEAAECGLACLAMVSTAHGFETDLRQLRQKFSTSLMGITLAQLMKNARELGFATRPLRLDPQELVELNLPCILHFDQNHFVVLSRINGSKYQLLDPASGQRYINKAELSARFTGIALELIPEKAFKRQKRRQADTSIVNLLGRVQGFPSALAKIVFLSMAIEGLALVGPLLNQWAVDEAIVSGDANLLYTIAGGLALTMTIQTATELLREYALLHLSASVNVQWFAKVCARMIQLPLGYFEKRQMGDVVSRIETIATIQTTVSNGFIEGIVDGLMAIGTFSMMWLYNARLAFISALILSIYVIIRFVFFHAARSAGQSQFVFSARLQSYLIETIRGIQTIKLFGKEGVRTAALVNSAVRSKNAALRTLRYGVVFRAVNSFLFRTEIVIVLAASGRGSY